jgi:hypothetical protein
LRDKFGINFERAEYLYRFSFFSIHARIVLILIREELRVVDPWGT